MPDLTTNYMGLALENPIIVASSHLTATLEKVRNCEKAGAGAVVLKSLFEEQIVSDTRDMMQDSGYHAHAEGLDFLVSMGKDYYINEYLKLIKQAKVELSMPIIARQRVVGVLRLYSAEKRQYSHEEISFLSALAEIAGVAIMNARIFEKTRNDLSFWTATLGYMQD